MFNLDRNTVFSSLMGILIISLVINCFTEIYNASVVFPVLGTLVVGGILVFSALFNRIAPFLIICWGIVTCGNLVVYVYSFSIVFYD